jgi:phospho-N-acetylmuramoyl-pentapeptide-transferase
LAFLALLISATTNTVNLTDGLDGLAAGTVTIVMLAYAGISFQQDHLDLAIFAAAVGGACIGFLWYNSYPADIFMGDTGAIGLGGAVAAMAVATKTELLLILIGGIYVIEGLSVIIQILVFRFTGKRVFKMAPIHHHFEMLGWSETKVMIRFWIVTGVLAGAGFALYFLSVT